MQNLKGLTCVGRDSVPFTWADEPTRSLPVVIDCEALETANGRKNERTTRFERVPVRIESPLSFVKLVFMLVRVQV